ncbi:hypothetical protein [Pseudonocardia zijingensis]|jgi:hypothetical protein|uniref:Uncharacterized protein n=1 Tax=Pseudonocardia zijingensis TaxID=153376 RepID=A0ABP4ARZ6_9PSEU
MRAAPFVAALAVATVVLWLVAFPADWSSVPTADPQTWESPLTAGHWAAALAGLAVLAFAGGYARGPVAALLGVAVPAVVLFCWFSATAEVIGANLWPVGALFLAPPLLAGVALAAALGAAARRHRNRV